MSEISQLLKRLGFSTTHNGYVYCRYAILLTLHDPSFMKHVTQRLYPCIADAFHVSSASVERSIRNAIESAWVRGDLSFIQNLFQYSIDMEKGKPTNSEFISVVVEYLQFHGYHEETEENLQLSFFDEPEFYSTME